MSSRLHRGDRQKGHDQEAGCHSSDAVSDDDVCVFILRYIPIHKSATDAPRHTVPPTMTAT
eukprot:2100183-Rhodomonas_salina.1